jgi:hypothetical protein
MSVTSISIPKVFIGVYYLMLGPDICLAEDPEVMQILQAGYRQDMSFGETADRLINEASVAVIRLPDEPWARRVSGVLGNKLALDTPHRAHAVLTEIPEGFLVSVRAPLDNRIGADTVCRQFPSAEGERRQRVLISCRRRIWRHSLMR